MKYRFWLRLIIVPAVLILSLPVGVRAEQGVERELQAIRDELEALRYQVAEQGAMIRTLYEFADALIGFEADRKEKDREQHLLLQPVAEIVDANLTHLAVANPAYPRVAALMGDGHVRVYDLTGQRVETLWRPDTWISAISYSPDGKWLLAGTRTGDLLYWDRAVDEWTVIATDVAGPISRVAWLGGTDKIVWSTPVRYRDEDGAPINRDQPSGGVLERTSGDSLWTFMSDFRRDYQGMSAAPNGSSLAILEILDQPRGAFVLDGATGDIEATLFHARHPSGPLSVAMAPDGRTVAVGYAPYNVILWDAEQQFVLNILEGHQNWVVSLAFTPDGRFLISGAGDSTARIWSVDSGEEIGRIRFPGQSTYVRSVGFSPDGRTAFALADNRIVIVEMPEIPLQANGHGFQLTRK